MATKTIPLVLLLSSILLSDFSALGQEKDSLVSLLQNSQPDSSRLVVLNKLSSLYSFSSPDSALLLAMQAKKLARSMENEPGLAEGYYNEGVAYHLKGDLKLASSKYDTAANLFAGLNHMRGLSKCLNNAAIIQTVKGNYVKGLALFQKALELKILVRDSSSIANTLNNIGNIKYDQKDFTEALEYYHQSLAMQESMQNHGGITRSLGNIALVYIEQKKYREAIKFYKKAFRLNKIHDIKFQNYYNADGLADAYLKLDKLDSARKYGLMANKGGQEINDPVIIAASSHVLGLLDMKIPNLNKAEQRLMQGMEVARKENLKPQLKNILETIYRLKKQQGKYKEALTYHEELYNLSDSLFNENLTKELTAREMNFAFQQERDSTQFAYEKETLALNSVIEQRDLWQKFTVAGLALVLLTLFVLYRFYVLKTRSNAQLKEKNSIISRSLEERESLIKEIHHRVKNNLQIISSLLNIQARFMQDELAKTALHGMQNRVLAMVMVHENLYQTENLTHVYADEYIGKLSHSIQTSLGSSEVDFQVDIAAVKIPSTKATKIGLMINELVTNAFKHAFPDDFTGEKQVVLSLKPLNSNLCIEVSDSGVGLIDKEIGQSYGLQLIESMTKSLKGLFSIDSNKGTKCHIKIPLEENAQIDPVQKGN